MNLTLPDPVTLADFAAAATTLAGRHIDRVIVDDEEWVASQVSSGVPESAARFTLSMFQATRSGHFAQSDPALTQLLGRQPRDIRQQLSEQSGTAGTVRNTVCEGPA